MFFVSESPQHCRAVLVVRQEPVRQGIEKRISLQFRECRDKHIATLKLYLIDFLELTGDATFVEPLLPLRVLFNLVDIDSTKRLALYFVENVGAYCPYLSRYVIGVATVD